MSTERSIADKPLKIMYLRPVGVAANNEVFAELARSCKLPGTEVHIASLSDRDGKFSHIEFRSYEAVVSRGIVRATWAAAQLGFDALAIGCFYDTALQAAREISGGMAVTAPCIAACEIAAGLSNRFGIIVGRRKWVNQMSAVVKAHGFGPKLAAFEPVELGVNDFLTDHQETERRLIAAGRRLVDAHHAEAVILGCTREIGFYRKVEKELKVPVIDAAAAAMKRAEYSAMLSRQCSWRPARKWSCEPPRDSESEAFRAICAEDAFSGRIVVEAELRRRRAGTEPKGDSEGG